MTNYKLIDRYTDLEIYEVADGTLVHGYYPAFDDQPAKVAVRGFDPQGGGVGVDLIPLCDLLVVAA